MKFYIQILLMLMCLQVHFIQTFQATRSANMDIPARSIQQPLLEQSSDSAAFYPSFYQHLNSFTAASSLSERAQAEQEASFPFISAPNSEQSSSSSASSSSATTGKYVAMHPIASQTVSSSSAEAIPVQEFTDLPKPIVLTLKSTSSKIFTHLQNDAGKQYGIDVYIVEQHLKNVFTKKDAPLIQSILANAIKSTEPSDWMLKVDRAGNFIILYGDRSRADFALYYRCISRNDLKKRTLDQQSHNDVVAIRYEPTTERIVASCENKLIKVFAINPLKLMYAFKSRVTTRYVSIPAVTTSRSFIIVGSASQLEVYRETNDSKGVEHVVSCELKYENDREKCVQEPAVLSLSTSTTKNKNTLVGLLEVDGANKESFFFTLKLPDLCRGNIVKAKVEIIRLPNNFHPKPYTILPRLDGSFLVPCNDDSHEIRFRKESTSSNKGNPYYQDAIEKQTIPAEVIFRIFTTVFKKAKENADEYLIFRRVPYASDRDGAYHDFDKQIAMPHLAFLPRNIQVLIYKYFSKTYIETTRHDCFYHGKRVPLIPLKNNLHACALNGNIIIFDITNLITLKVDPKIKKILPPPIPF